MQHTTTNHDEQAREAHHVPVWLKLLTALLGAAFAYFVLGGGGRGWDGVLASLLGSVSHNLAMLLEAAWEHVLHAHQARSRARWSARKTRTLALAGVALAALVAVPTAHWLMPT